MFSLSLNILANVDRLYANKKFKNCIKKLLKWTDYSIVA